MIGFIKRKDPVSEPVSEAERELEAVLAELLQVGLDDAEALQTLKAESRRLQDIIASNPDLNMSDRVLRALP